LKETQCALDEKSKLLEICSLEKETMLEMMEDKEKRFAYEKWAFEALLNRKVIELNQLIKSNHILQYQCAQKDLDIRYLEQFVDVIKQSSLNELELEDLNELKDKFSQNYILVKDTILQRLKQRSFHVLQK